MKVNVPIDRIMKNPWQTRDGEPDAERIKELALDIAQNGLLQVPVGRLWNGSWTVPVETFEPDRWETLLHEENELVVQLAFGHRRLEAFKWLHVLRNNSNIPGDYSSMPVEIREMSDEEMARLAWSENEKREGVNAADRAQAIERWMKDFGWSQAEVGEKLGLARSTVSNILRLGGLPGNILEALRQGLISERVGMALLPMYRLPERILKLANSDYYCRPKDIEREALEGKSSDSVRGDVSRLYDNYTVKLQGTLVRLDEVYPEGDVAGYDAEGGKIYCGTCRACDLRLKDEGNVCLDKKCFKAKEAVAKRRYLVQASQASGIKAVDPNKGGNTTPLPYNEEDTRKILGTKCENLRLEYTETKESIKEDARRVEGWEHDRIVCDKRNQSCTCIKGLEVMRNDTFKRVGEVMQAQKEADPDYEGEDAREYSGVDVEFEGDDPEEDLVRMVDEEKEAEVGASSEQRRLPGAPTIDAKGLEEAARVARRAKADVSKHYGEVREKVKKVLVEALQRDEPGAFYVVAHHNAYVATWRKDPLNLTGLYNMLAEDALQYLVSANANNVDELYEIANRNLEQLGLERVNQAKTLVEIFQEGE